MLGNTLFTYFMFYKNLRNIFAIKLAERIYVVHFILSIFSIRTILTLKYIFILSFISKSTT